MNDLTYRNFRPRLHFTPEAMWMNDPNGMVYANGKYHLFYQHNPADTCWGPMHWGHAASVDLIHWTHLPVALVPDETGMIFSGSSVFDEKNTSGFGISGIPPIVAMYTSHGEYEQQSIAYSMDGVNYEKYMHNPVILNPGIADFRDPKLFYNEINNCWSMVLAAKDRVFFYASEDLKHWNKTGEFGPAGNYASGVWECPDFFPLSTDAGIRWVLLVSMTTTVEEGRSYTQYFIGDFDGSTFICTMPFKGVERFDHGFDNYAGVTFSNTRDRIFMGWAMNWGYANDTPTGDYRGQMTLARRLSLVNVPEIGLRLAGELAGLDDFISGRRIAENDSPLPGEVFYLRIEGSGASSIILSNREGQQLIFGIDDNNKLFVDRTNAGIKDFSEQFASSQYSKCETVRLYEGSYVLDAIFDVSVLELFVDSGTRSMTLTAYPYSPYTRINATGNVTVELAEINV